MRHPVAVFRVSFWREWLSLFVPCQLTALLMPGIAVALLYPDIVPNAGELAAIVWVAAAGLASIASLLKTILNYWRCRVRVGLDAIDGYDLLGWRESIPWDWVKEVQRRWYWAPYLRVTSNARQDAIWLPLHLTDFPEFVETIAEYAGSDHPLTIALYAEGDFD